MRYWFLTLIGAGLFVGSLVLFSVKLTELLETGTCASGNQPFEIARPCPEGTGTDILLLTASVFGALIGAGLLLFRGGAPSGRPRRFSTGLMLWAVGFSGTGAFVLYHSLTSDAIPPDGELGGIIVGVTFLFMGLPALLFAAAGAAGARGDPTPQGRAEDVLSAALRARRASRTSGGGDRISELERLDRLRQSGALSQAEFEREKARVLGR